MRSPRHALALIALALCCTNLVVTLWRSTIPIEVEGTLEKIEFLTEDNPGIDEIYVLHIDGSEFHVDKAVATRLTANVHVSKDAWSTEMVVGRYAAARTIDVRPSADFIGMALVMPVVALVVVILLFVRSREPGTAT